MKLFGKNLKNNIALIAEIGVNHEGDFKKAKELIGLAARSGADAVKFQSYTPERYVSADTPDRLQRVTHFALSEIQHHELKAEADKFNIPFFSSALSEDWVSLLSELGEVIKIASADITFEAVIRAAAKTGKKVILSTGGSTLDEIHQAVSWVQDEVGKNVLSERLILLHCISSYPAPPEEANLLSIPFLAEQFPDLIIGFSNHSIGREVVAASVALGARVVEVHFTDQKEDRDFHDHKLSADPSDIAYYAKHLPMIAAMRGTYGKTPQACEREIVPIIRKGLIVNKDLKAGDILREEDIVFARPATGFKSNELHLVIGKELKNDLNSGHSITPDMI